MSFFSPLEQFEIKFFTKINCFDYFFIEVTTFSIYSLVIFFIISFFFLQNFIDGHFIPTKWQFFFENIYMFVLDIIKRQTGNLFFEYFPLLFTTFTFIATANLSGLLPYSYTLTSEIIVTWLLAFSFNIAWFLVCIYKYNIKFFKLFIPSGIKSILLLFIIFIIEIISYLFRTFSLSVRLFANIMAGHTLLHILASFAIKMSYSQNFFLNFFPLSIIVLVFLLEFGIAIIQAYVFLILVIIYMSDISSINKHLNLTIQVAQR